jgi:hypothetical protein
MIKISIQLLPVSCGVRTRACRVETHLDVLPHADTPTQNDDTSVGAARTSAYATVL